jgi:hypothetical protein
MFAPRAWECGIGGSLGSRDYVRVAWRGRWNLPVCDRVAPIGWRGVQASSGINGQQDTPLPAIASQRASSTR